MPRPYYLSVMPVSVLYLFTYSITLIENSQKGKPKWLICILKRYSNTLENR